MAKQKRLNKTLIAFLTCMGVIVLVSVAALIIRQGTQRDPEVIARNARSLEDTGTPESLEKAVRLYQRAYAASNERDSKYLLDVARVAMKLGDLGSWINTLKRVNSKTPDDPAPLVDILRGLWEIRILADVGQFWPEWRDVGSQLLQIDQRAKISDDERALAAASRAWGMWNAGVAETAGQAREAQAIRDAWGTTGEECAKRLFDQLPTNALAATTYVEAWRRQVQADYQKAVSDGAGSTELERIARGYTPKALELLRPALAANPTDLQLVLTFTDFARQEYAQLASEKKFDEADALIQSALSALDAAIAAQPKEPELAFARGRVLAEQASAAARAGKFEKIEPLRTAIAAAAEQATQLDPAMYQAYTLQADAIMVPSDPNGSTPAQLKEQYARVLKLYEEARDRTLALKSLRALLTKDQRLLMVFRGFLAALANIDLARGTGEEALRVAGARTKAFLDDAQAQAPDLPLTNFMEGTYLMTQSDGIGAIKAFERANEGVKTMQAVLSGAISEGRLWIRVFGANAVPAERLASLYKAGGELGAALKYADQALLQYERDAAAVPPRRLVLDAAELRLGLDRGRDALDLLERFKQYYGDDREYTGMRARALAAVGRKDEAAQVAASVATTGPAGDVDGRLWQARQALDTEDFELADHLARGVVSDASASDAQVQGALQLVIVASERNGQRDAALSYVRSLLANPPRESLVRLLKSYEITLGETDPQKRDEQLVALIREITDPAAREERLMNFYAARGQSDEALKHAEELRRLRPNNDDVLATQFGLRIDLKQYDKANELISTLSQSDGGKGYDQAGGATFRARLALAQGNAELAIREYRQAIQALPASAELLTGIAESYMAAQRYSEAAEALQRAIASNPRSVRAHGLLVDTLDALAQRSGAAERANFEKQADATFETLAKLAPKNPFVVARREMLAENKNPRDAIRTRLERLAKDPNDLKNVGRIGELYREAWRQADAARDERVKAELIAGGDAFYEKEFAALSGGDQFSLARLGADFYAATNQREKGEQFLRNYIEHAADAGTKILTQIMLARFLEMMRDLPEAERAYQQAQVLVRDYKDADAAKMEQVRSRVGIELIDFYQRSGRPLDVVEACNWFINLVGESNPDVGDVRLRLVDAYISARMVDDARRECDKYFQKYGSTVNGLAARARLNLSARQTREQAYQDLTAILQLEPQNDWALVTRGWLSLRRARYNEARDDLTAARAVVAPLSPLGNRLYMLLSQYYSAVRQPDLALEALRSQLEALRARDAAPEQVEPVVVELVRTYRKFGKYEDAQKLISEYMERQPTVARWPSLLADALRERAETAAKRNDGDAARRDYIAAASYYARAAERYTDADLLGLASAVAQRLECLVQAGQPAEALTVFQQFPIDKLSVRPASVPEPTWPILAARIRATIYPAFGHVQWALNDQTNARSNLRRALSDAAEAHFVVLRAVTDSLLKYLPPAEIEALLSSAVEGASAGTQAGQFLRIALADFWQRMANTPGTDSGKLRQQALAILDEVDKAAGTNGLVLGVMLNQRAQVIEATGDEKGAIACYEQALRLDQNNRVALNNLAFLLVSAKDAALRKPESAVALAERLAALVEDDETANAMFDTIGWVYYQYGVSAKDRRGYLDQALEALQQSLALKSDGNYDAQAHLAQVLVELGRSGEARDVLMRAVSAARTAGDSADEKRLDELLKTIK